MTDRKPATGPLVGLRVLDLTRLLPGPLGTMLMADMGAEVIRIENPNSPDYVRMFPPHIEGESVNYLMYNRSKKSVLLDYQTPEGRAQFLDLVTTADVVVEQFRPGYLDRLGLGYATARARNPRVIYVSVTGYGQTGPYARLAGHDLNYLGISGVLGLTGNPAEAPTLPGVQLADIAGGSYGCVMGTLAAVYARERTGEGQHVDVSMTDAVMPLLSVAYSLFAGGMNPQRGQMPLSGGLPNYGVYPTKPEPDGRVRYVVLGALEPKFWLKFCNLLNKPDWMGFMLPQSPDELVAYKNQLQDLFLERTQAEWVQFGTEHDLLITPVHDLADLATDPHLTARNMVLTEHHPVVGSVPSIGVPIKFSATPAQPAWPAPKLGEDGSHDI
ncbi:CaiB/BaiF CoA transferase family protein [Rudanella lutea]|uniref:CaiB/BaiF CoA transferase family protein n=1 Tax=Rudanella lutea TaxID=451374 RepID=UPI00036ED551|nr:CoA transferase [Rudanella lutea]